MERVKEAGTPNVAMGQARERTRSMQQAVTKEPLPPRPNLEARSLARCGKKLRLKNGFFRWAFCMFG